MTYSSEDETQSHQLDESTGGMTEANVDLPLAERPINALQADSQPDYSMRLEDLTLADMAGQLIQSPRSTVRALRQVISASSDSGASGTGTETVTVVQRRRVRQPVIRSGLPQDSVSDALRMAKQREVFLLSTRGVAFGLAVYGNWVMSYDRIEATGLTGGLPYLLAAFLVWIAGDVFTNRTKPAVHSSDARDEIDVLPAPIWGLFSRDLDLITLALRVIGISLAIVMSLITFSATAKNHFTFLGFITWLTSIVLWVLVLAPREWGVGAFVQALRNVRLPNGWTRLALMAIIAVAVLFRFSYLNSIPTEMTSDHVEKILDAQSILSGNPQVFFPNNGGREPIQFYLMAVISQLPGLGLNFFTLKFLTAVEGLICIPILWWMGREIIGEDEPQLGNVVGLILAALVATSYWHTMLSRLGLRIVLTVVVTALLMIYLSRGLRYNRRGDFIKAGLILGFGVYAYQAVRMLPVVVVAGVVLAIVFALFKARRWEQVSRYLFHTATLVLLTVVVFVPMWGFARDYPEDFWRRTSGRLLGDDLVQTVGADGQTITREATIEERMGAFQQNLGILLNNIRNALLMYNWKGDVAWITAVPNRPQMDVISGSLLIVGLGAWGVRMVKRRDAADWLMPAALFIMLLPSALSIAYPIENPSATRTSGSLPEAYLFAALPLALVCIGVYRLAPDWRGKIGGGAVAGALLLLSASANWNTYFVDFRDSYNNSAPAPYTEAGRFLRGFADSGGALGNAFMVAYPYWWDHRAIGIEAGVTDWPNGIVSRDDIPAIIKDAPFRSDAYRLDPDKDLLFFYHPDDVETGDRLQKWFPKGVAQRISSYKPGADYMVFRVPKLGVLGLQAFDVSTGQYYP